MAKGRRVLLAWFREDRSNWKLELLFLAGAVCVFGVGSVMQASASPLSSTITYHISDTTNGGDCTTIGTPKGRQIFRPLFNHFYCRNSYSSNSYQNMTFTT